MLLLILAILVLSEWVLLMLAVLVFSDLVLLILAMLSLLDLLLITLLVLSDLLLLTLTFSALEDDNIMTDLQVFSYMEMPVESTIFPKDAVVLLGLHCMMLSDRPITKATAAIVTTTILINFFRTLVEC